MTKKVTLPVEIAQRFMEYASAAWVEFGDRQARADAAAMAERIRGAKKEK